MTAIRPAMAARQSEGVFMQFLPCDAGSARPAPPEGPETRTIYMGSIDASARSILGQYGAGDHLEEVIRSRRERRLIPEPCERPQQSEQISAIHIGPGHSLFLSADKQAGAG